jgi:CBS domain-containing protein
MSGPDKTDKLTVPLRRDSADAVDGTVADLIHTAPIVGWVGMTVREAAALMTDREQDYLVVPLADGQHAVLTDADIRARVVAAGRGTDTPVTDVLTGPAYVLHRATPAVEALTELLERNLTVIPVVADGEVIGVVAPADFVSVPVGTGMALRGQIVGAATDSELTKHGRRIPALIADLIRRGRPVHEITRTHSLLNDALVKRGLDLVVAEHPEVDGERITWLSLGSNARREPVLSSDVDSAVSLADSVPDEEVPAYRQVFSGLDEVLREAGMRIDTNGAVASMPLFCRTHSQWRTAAQRWIDDPLENKGMIFTSLMLDARTIWGRAEADGPGEMLTDLRSHPRTLSLLLSESLATRARMRSIRDVVTRNDIVDIKQHALTPLVNIARWAALSVGAAEMDTRSRLRAASGSEMLSDDQASTLIEVFDVLQRVRLTYQVAQFDRGEEITDEVSMKRLSPLDRSLVGQAVREVAGAQRRLANLRQYVPVGEQNG